MWLLLAACAQTSADDSSASPSCVSDLAPGEVALVAEGFDAGTEGVAFVDGRLFVSVPDGVVEVAADGTTTPFVSTGHALGLAAWDGAIVVADPGEFTFDGSGDDGRVLRVDLDGTTTPLAEGLPNPNFVVAAPWGGVLLSDDTNETLWHVDATGAVPWIEGIPSPNGLDFAPDGRTLYVATTFAPDPPVWAVPVDGAGTPGTPVALATLPTGSAPDGLVVDADGRVLVAANLAGDVVIVDPGTGATTDLATGLDTPASLAFGAGAGWDTCSVYATSLYGTAVSRVGVGRPAAW